MHEGRCAAHDASAPGSQAGVVRRAAASRHAIPKKSQGRKKITGQKGLNPMLTNMTSSLLLTLAAKALADNPPSERAPTRPRVAARFSH